MTSVAEPSVVSLQKSLVALVSQLESGKLLLCRSAPTYILKYCFSHYCLSLTSHSPPPQTLGNGCVEHFGRSCSSLNIANNLQSYRQIPHDETFLTIYFLAPCA
jgi:hypothetical protein